MSLDDPVDGLFPTLKKDRAVPTWVWAVRKIRALAEESGPEGAKILRAVAHWLEKEAEKELN